MTPVEVIYRIQPAMGKAVRSTEVLACTPEDPLRPWHAACDALAASMAENMQRHLRMQVILSDRLMRYLVLPWRPGITSRAEWRAYALHSFEQVYGEEARTWRLRIEVVPPGRPSLACAVEEGLLESLRDVARSSSSRLVSVRPRFVALFNQRRAVLRGSPLWFAVAEPHSLSVGLLVGGVWQALRNEPAPDGWSAALPGMVSRMQVMAGTGETGTLYVHASDGRINLPETVAGLAVRAMEGGNLSRMVQSESAAMVEA
jgi:hypothetical protein